ncbi:protein TolR [Paenalcaligenes suwonensis]|uniref:protein TolR n=1 Tax=Paenalcaligenes suwonensis TaxID=1202713 RepID=UPI001409087D|nr:protein TolR [Paenalcaligenes suwonensis]NHC60586.1 protein TolR [Paenalcaligenes suwonensis]
MPSIRNSTGRGRRRLKNDINVVPYIDVMLVLLVIFMVTAPMITPGIIDLPTVGQASEVRAVPIEVQVDKEGKVALRLREGGSEFKDIDKANLIAEIQTLMQNDNPIVIAADGKVPYETIMELMDQLRSQGFTRLGLLVNKDE